MDIVSGLDNTHSRVGAVRYKSLAPAVAPVADMSPRRRPLASLGAGVPAVPAAPYNSAYAYDGAVPISQDMLAWLPWQRSPDSEINADRDRIVARARDLFRNDGWASGSINRIADSAIGAQFFPVPRPIWRVLQRRLGKAYDDVWAREFASAMVSEWRSWADDPAKNADATRRLTVTQIFRQAFKTKLIEGDALAMLPWQPDQVGGAGGARYATTIQLIDPDRLSNPQHGPDTIDRRGGVQIDGVGAAIGYHICRGHQNDYYLVNESTVWDYYPRSMNFGRPFVVHDFDGDRASQHRGVGILTAVLGRFRMLNRYDQTSLQAAILRTVLGFFITSSQSEDDVGDALDPSGLARNMALTATATDAVRTEINGAPVTMGGVRVPVLGPGEKMQSVGGNGQGDDFAAFESAVIRSISSATGQSSEEISNDFSKLNYSSFRGALLQSWRTLIRRRRDFQWGFADPVYAAFTEEAIATTLTKAGVMPRGFTHDDFLGERAALCRADWIGPGRGWVDPVKERQGEVLGLDAGFGTLEQTCADIGGVWWEDTLDQRAHEEATMKKLGLSLPDWAGGMQLTASETDAKPEPE